ncbi:hypothetical protein Leryth_001304 [Lithospermum erythrorhizon]|nr:hypothetical protein Leryth_001304 [Lithospermum erythrorhizon]
MEEEKAAAYYDELSRKGSGAARFKQGLGFSTNDAALPSSSSFVNTFVKASTGVSETDELDKGSQLRSIQNKLNSKSKSNTKIESQPRRSERDSRRRSRERDESQGYRNSKRSRSRSGSGRNETSLRGEKSVKDEGNGRVDYTKLIQGYDQMAPAERVKAKMKLQLTETAKKDPTRGTGSGWERFAFDKDATLDDEEEIEAAEDDTALVKHIGQSFRFSAIEARKEDQIKAAHDEAMFGAPTLQSTPDTNEEKENSPKCANDTAPDTSLISNQVISMQQVSWRDRVKKM